MAKERRKPDFEGKVVKIWKAPDRDPPDPNFAAHINTWLIHYPGINAAWSWWSWSLISLADYPGVEPAKKTAPENTHEILGFALNPEKGEPDVDSPGPFPFLTPPDLTVQFSVENDAMANALIRKALRVMCVGRAPGPDADFRQHWTQFFETQAAASRGQA